eukprot:g26631.t1
MLDWPILEPELSRILAVDADPIRSLARGDIGAIVVRRAFPPEECAALIRRLIDAELMYEGNDPRISEKALTNNVVGKYLGRDVNPDGGPRRRIDIGASLGNFGDDRADFFRRAAEARERFDTLFANGPDPIATLYQNLQSLLPGKQVATAHEPDGSEYGPAIIRVHYGGFTYGPHFDSVRNREQRTGYAVHRFETQLAGVLCLQNSTREGVSAQGIVHRQFWNDEVDPFLKTSRFHEYAKEQRVANIRIELEPGDLYFFNTGQIHEVPGVPGDLPRVVLATFIGYSEDDPEVMVRFFEPRLTGETVSLAEGFSAVCVFVNDILDAGVLERLAAGGTRVVALRCAGFNNVDLTAAERLGMKVVRVPAYSPCAVAEHTVGLMLTLNRKIHRAYARVREGNFALNGLLGFDLHGRTVGIVGTGQIGAIVARIMSGFGCRLLGFDLHPDSACEAMGLQYGTLDEVLSQSDIVTLHCPLTPDTRHLINAQTINQLKPNVMLINTSRGAVIDTRAVIDGLKSGQIGSLGIDVYEEEADYFFEDLSHHAIADDVLARLLTFPNVLVTGHQAFFTQEALDAIAETTLRNLQEIEQTGASANEVLSQKVQGRE